MEVLTGAEGDDQLPVSSSEISNGVVGVCMGGLPLEAWEFGLRLIFSSSLSGEGTAEVIGLWGAIFRTSMRRVR